MKTLFYLPTGLATPELEVMLSIIQKKLDEKKKVTILTCSGGKFYHCNKIYFL